jgi:hypothetical protein
MASACILAKSSRSPLKKLPDRLIPAAAIDNGDRPPSPQGEGGNYGQDMLPPSPSLDEQARDRIERREGLDAPPHLSTAGLDPDDSKEAGGFYTPRAQVNLSAPPPWEGGGGPPPPPRLIIDSLRIAVEAA